MAVRVGEPCFDCTALLGPLPIRLGAIETEALVGAEPNRDGAIDECAVGVAELT